MSKPDKDTFSSAQFLQDIETTAAVVGAETNPELCARLVTLFEEDFRRNVIQWKITDVPGSSLYYRFLSTDHTDPVQRAIDAKLLDCSHDKLLRLQPGVIEAIPGAVRSGVDFDAMYGLAKVWTYTTPIPIEAALRVDCLPKALLSHRHIFKRFGFEGVGFFASDFINKTMTIYFGWRQSPVNRRWLEDFFSVVSKEPVSEDTIQNVLDSAQQLRGVSMTFSWERDEIVRSGIYRFGLDYDKKELRSVLPLLTPRLERLMTLAPTLNEESCYHLAWSFGSPCHYMKLEKNYALSVHQFLASERGIIL